MTQHCGELATQYVYASNNLVHPIVAVIDRPHDSWQPDPVEVAEVITFPLVSLINREGRCEVALRREVRQQDDSVGEMVFRAPAFRYGSHAVWGATALILDQLARILHSEGVSL